MNIQKNSRGESLEVRLALPRGLHARPSAKLAQLAQTYQSNISLINDNGEADAKSILDILSLSAQKGDKIIILANGPDAGKAILAIAKFCLDSRDYYGPGAS